MVNNKVIWSEGLLLQAQHFQQQDRYLEHYVQQRLLPITNHAWGFSELTLDTDLLSLGKLGIRSAVGIFEDGTPFNIPIDTTAPTPMDIPEGLQNTPIFLTLPLKQSGKPEVGEHGRYAISSMKVTDTIENHQNNVDIQVGTLALQITSEPKNSNQLAIACIEESRSQNNITLDKNFIPPSLNIQRISTLKNSLMECHGLLQHRATMLADRLTDTQQAGTAEVVDLMLLQIVNKYQPLLHYFSHKNPLHPETLFQLFIQIIGEMATFTNNRRRPIEIPQYNHTDLFATFEPILTELRHALSMVLEQNASSIKLNPQAGGLWVGDILDKELLKTCQFVLAIYADVPTETIRTTMVTQLKIAPVEHIRNLVSRALPGIDINPIAIAPRQIPYHANFAYFSLNQKHPLWPQLQNSAGIAFHTGTDFPGLKLEFWAIKG